MTKNDEIDRETRKAIWDEWFLTGNCLCGEPKDFDGMYNHIYTMKESDELEHGVIAGIGKLESQH